MSNADHASPDKAAEAFAPPAAGGLLTPKELRTITEEHEREVARKAAEEEKRRQEEHDALRDAFLHQHIRADARDRFTRAVRIAAENGLRELQLLHFPSSYCSDGGRAINNFEPDWPRSLTGYAREIHEAYEANLRPLGYRLEAAILNYPGGMPGDVGLFLRW
ncbi:PIN domain-containing protein [Azospirillum agricola]|uniref:hypothetical protein n=1 Tax=Azospirillum agricola TaxID=1720247 RepID=UPI000A0F100B|nr:hypothetical protein [Azospirillum agricola]MBP2230856.1 hypothetical protein [Azospirillum agricola]SMH29383.1 hypothetical protein SAMN02982994_0163 [Azospirillum lipoferum]